MTQLAFDRQGGGPPLVLLHGLGLSRRSWDPVVTTLARPFDVTAVDLPGFGDSGPLPGDVEPTPAALAAAVDKLLDGLGIDAPHVVGNSLGGWVALELAGVRPVASLTLLSPAGLWRDRTPMYARVSLLASRWLARRLGRLLSRLASYRAARVVILGQTHGRPARMSAEQARTTIQTLGRCPGFNATLAATTHRRYLAGPALDAPVTVAFGSRDLILLRRQSHHIDQLPPGTQIQELPSCGHVPMSDDPNAVIAVITATVARAARSTTSDDVRLSCSVGITP
jgi:pimeloyl-ACP methyl ester carboxylesterase